MLKILNQIHGISNIYIDELEDLSDIISRQRDGSYQNEMEKIESQKQIIRSDSSEVYSLFQDNEENKEIKRINYTPSIYKAINNKEVLKITYEPPSTNPSKIICHPYLIAESNDRWYLIAYVEEALEKESVFITKDRIGKINLLETKRIIDEPENLKNEYIEKIQLDELHNILNDTVGVRLFSNDDYHNSWEQPKREELKLELDEKLVFYFTTKPLIGGREEKINEKYIYTRPNTIFTNELKQKILSYGKQIKVIKPTWLKKQIGNEIEEMKKNYNL
jgi:predicted DNA-binding transcriptional regulator YafY